MFVCENTCNLCYFNSVLQVLFSIDSFVKYLSEYNENKCKKCSGNVMDWNIACQKDTIFDAGNDTEKNHKETNINEIIKKRCLVKEINAKAGEEILRSLKEEDNVITTQKVNVKEWVEEGCDTIDYNVKKYSEKKFLLSNFSHKKSIELKTTSKDEYIDDLSNIQTSSKLILQTNIDTIINEKNIIEKNNNASYNSVHTILSLIYKELEFEKSDTFPKIETKKYFLKFADLNSFNGFKLNKRNDTQIFLERLLIEIRHESNKKSLKTEIQKQNLFLDSIEIITTVYYKLVCGHSCSNTLYNYIYTINHDSKISLQKIINDLNTFSSYKKQKVLCYTCVAKKKCLFRTVVFNCLPAYIFIEIERAYKKNGAIFFYDKKLMLSDRIKINECFYTIHAAILYENMHYTTIIKKDGHFYQLNNASYNKLNFFDGLEMIEKLSRMIVLRKI
ncbi:hypothetical protein COBT_000995 [Conglomerata obtusa]